MTENESAWGDEDEARWIERRDEFLLNWKLFGPTKPISATNFSSDKHNDPVKFAANFMDYFKTDTGSWMAYGAPSPAYTRRHPDLAQRDLADHRAITLSRLCQRGLYGLYPHLEPVFGGFITEIEAMARRRWHFGNAYFDSPIKALSGSTGISRLEFTEH